MSKEIYLAGGCFWGVEKYLGYMKGVINTEVGYANGNTENPTYEEVCHNDTGHAEEYHQEYLDKNPSGYCHIGRDKFEKVKQSKLLQKP